MRLDDAICNGKPQTAPALLTGSSFVNTIKTLKNSRQITGWDADSRICNREADISGIHFSGERYRSALGCKLDRVMDKINKKAIEKRKEQALKIKSQYKYGKKIL